MKNNFKHIIALLLVLVMSFQMAAFVTADETIVIEGEAGETVVEPINLREFQILDALDIFALDYDDKYTGYRELTRSEAAAISAHMLGIGDGYSMEGKAMPYSDVSGTDTHAYEIYHITNLGIMNGYAGLFNPDDTITEEQFVKVLVETLGYRAEAQAMGGYPYGYTITAGKYHILDGVDYKGNVPLTDGIAVQMVYNSLFVETPNFVSFDNGGFITTVSNTIMNQYLDVTKDYGVLKRNSTTFMGIGDPSKKGVVQVGDEYYYVGTSGCDEYIGYNVEFFYKKTVGDQIGTIIYAAPWNNEVIHIEDQNIAGYANHEYRYYVDNVEKKAKFPAGAYVLYNDVLYEPDSKDYVPEIGYVELIDNDIDGDIEVVSITSYDVYEIKANNTTEFVITAEDGKQIKDYDKAVWNVVDVNGEKLPAAKVAGKQVLLLAVSKDGKVVNGFEINEQIEGTFQSKYTEGGVHHIVINDTDYRVHPYCANDYQTIKLGDYVGFYVYEDMLLIKCLPASSLTESVGYLIEMGQEPGLMGKVMARMMLQTGEVKIVTINDKAKLTLGGNTHKEPIQFKTLLTYTLEHYVGEEVIESPAGTPETTVRQPVVYKLNEAGEVILLEASATHNYNEKVSAASETDGFNLVHMVRGREIRVTPGLRSIGDDAILLEKDAFVIDVPTDIDNYDGYKMYKFSELRMWDTGNTGNFTRPYRLYRTGNDIAGANIMVGTAVRNNTNSGGTTFILDKIAEGITEDGTECYILSGKTTSLTDVSVKTKDKSIFDSHTSPSITIGDLISCSKDSYGLVDLITMRYDRETATVVSNSGSYLGYGAFNVGGQVYMIKGDTMVSYPGLIPEDIAFDSIKDSLKYLDIAGYEYVIFDPSLDRAESHLIGASLGEVKTYVEDPQNVTTFVATKNGIESGIFIIYRK